MKFVSVASSSSNHNTAKLDWRWSVACLIAISMPTHSWAEEQQTLKEVTVTATGVDIAERRDSNTQKVVIDRKEIEKMSAMTVSEVLGKLPGVELNSNGMGQQTRGMSRDSVQVLVDGERSAIGRYLRWCDWSFAIG